MAADFDTLSFARRMEAVGFTRAQAEALAEEQARLIDDRLATKADLAQTNRAIEQSRTDLTRDIAQLRADVTREIAQLRAELTRDIEALRQEARASIELLRRDLVTRLGGIVIASVAAGSAIVTVLARLH